MIECPLAAMTAVSAANTSQNETALCPWRTRRVMAMLPARITANARTSPGLIGPHHSTWGSARCSPSTTNATTSARFDGLKMWEPLTRIRYFEAMPNAAVPANTHQPCMLHQSPGSVPGTRRISAMPLPVSMALAGHAMTLSRRNVIVSSIAAQVPIETRICAIDTLKSKTTCPSTWSVVVTMARCRRGSVGFGSWTG